MDHFPDEDTGPLDQGAVPGGDDIDDETGLHMALPAVAAGGDMRSLYEQLSILPSDVRNKVIQQLMTQHAQQHQEQDDDEDDDEDLNEHEGMSQGQHPEQDHMDSARMAAYNQAVLYQQQQAHHQHHQQQYMLAQHQYLVASAALHQAKQNNAPLEEQQRAQQAMLAASLAQQSILAQHQAQQAMFKQQREAAAAAAMDHSTQEEASVQEQHNMMEAQRQQQMMMLMQQQGLRAMQAQQQQQQQQQQPDMQNLASQQQMAQIHALATHHAHAAAMACARRGGSKDEQTRDAHAAYTAVMQAQHHVQVAAAAAAAAAAGRGDDDRRGFKRMRDASQPMRPSNWTADEDNKLCSIVDEHGAREWKKISSLMGGKFTDVQCLHRWNKVLKPGLRKGPWTEHEDQVVANLVRTHGVGKIKWSQVAEKLPGRIGKQCRERWFNHLDPNINKTEWAHDENMRLYNNQRTLGNKWSQIAKLMPGRTENGVKNRFNSSAYRKWCNEHGLVLEGASRRRTRKQAPASQATHQAPTQA